MAEGDFYIDVKTAAGTITGAGPLTDVVYWEYEDRLSKDGAIRFEMPARSPQASYIDRDYIVTCYVEYDGDIAEVGSGIVKRIEFSARGRGRESLVISGPGRMAELTNQRVKTLKVATPQWVTPSQVLEHDPVGGTNTDLPNTYDDNTGTYNTVTLASTEYLYIRMTTGMSGARFNFDTFNTTNPSTMTVQYYRAGEWIDVSSLSDGTAKSGATWAQDGDMTWTLPDDADLVSHNDERGYWLRMIPSASLTAVQIAEVDVRVDDAATTALADIIAYHSSWSFDTSPSHGTGYNTTADTLYHQFSWETVLAALYWVSKQTGEHFRYGGAQTIVWMRSATTASGIRADKESDPLAAEDEDGICHIESLRQVEDSYDVITRIYPFGAGMGASRVDLSLATMSMPADYTLDTVNNCIIYEPSGTEPSPSVEGVKNWPDIRAAEARDGKSEEASNALAQRALQHLQEHISTNKAYTLQLVGLKGRLYPLDTIHVTYQAYRDGEQPIDIDDDLVVLSATTRVDARGVRTVRITAAESAAWPQTDAGAEADAMQQMQSSYAHGQPLW